MTDSAPYHRPTKYKKEFCKIAVTMCSMGAIDKDLAEAFNVSTKTINSWKLKHLDFLQSLKKGKSRIDDRIKDSLLHRALGYSHEHSVFHVIREQVVETPTTKHYPPDTTACIFWLKNRCRDEFTESKEGNSEDMVNAMLTLAKSLPK